MNDFTKAELQIIYLDMKFYAEQKKIRGCQEANYHFELRDKVESMIDNYCEHQKDVWPLYTATGDIPSAGMCYECDNPVDRKFINE